MGSFIPPGGAGGVRRPATPQRPGSRVGVTPTRPGQPPAPAGGRFGGILKQRPWAARGAGGAMPGPSFMPPGPGPSAGPGPGPGSAPGGGGNPWAMPNPELPPSLPGSTGGWGTKPILPGAGAGPAIQEDSASRWGSTGRPPMPEFSSFGKGWGG